MSSTSRLLDAACAAAAATSAENRDEGTCPFVDDYFKLHEEAMRVHLDDFRALQEVALTRFACKLRSEFGRICARLVTQADVTSGVTTANIADAFLGTVRDSLCLQFEQSSSALQGQHRNLGLQQTQPLTAVPTPAPATCDGQDQQFSRSSGRTVGTEPGRPSKAPTYRASLMSGPSGASSTLKFCSPPTLERTPTWSRLTSGTVVNGYVLDLTSGVVVTCFAIFIGIETDFMSKNQGNSHEAFKICHCIFNVLFAAEVLLRFKTDGRHFLSGQDRWWNAVDFVMVLASVFETLFEFLAINDTVESRQMVLVVKTLRVLRLVKTCRIARSLRYMHEFKRMVFAFQGSLTTLSWCMALIIAMLYIFAIFFTQGCTDYISARLALGSITAESLSLHFTSDDTYDLRSGMIDEIMELRTLWSGFGSLPRSIFSLYAAISNGRDWEDVMRPIMGIHWVYTVVFVSFITFSIFGLVNVLTSIFLESVMKSVLHHRELLVQNFQAKKAEAVGHLRELFFMQIEGTDGREIRVADMKKCFETSAECASLLEACEISINDIDVLIALIDRDRSGTIGVDEFCDGCLKLKGPAKSFDIHCMMYELLGFLDKFASFKKSCETRSNDLAKRLTALNSCIIAQNRDLTKAMAALQLSITSLSSWEVARGRIDGCSHKVFRCSSEHAHGWQTWGRGDGVTPVNLAPRGSFCVCADVSNAREGDAVDISVDSKSSDAALFRTDSLLCRLDPRNDSSGGPQEIVKEPTKLSL
eukprot:TRINITY_DN6961_c0_g2_i1.p1 TRINITY_DN6961_c0_g2~~TRINITY_DN6961_c0_g2_i1.p1  ORF type:complete len:757 (+),score=105.20 TRINITY_DN6961_c0_g2_i1:88-2358(+)